MGYTVNFTHNQLIDSGALNTVAEGIDESVGDLSLFQNGTVYGVDALNAITKSLITKGVSTGCDVSFSDGIITISQGEAFFECGKKIIIDAEGITISASEGTEYYVYLLNDEVSGAVLPKCTEEYPSGDYVMLAKVSSGGYVYSQKDIALMKNASLFPNSYAKIKDSFPKSSTTKEYTLELGENYRRMVLISEQSMIFINWDENKWFRDEDEYDITEDKLPYLSCGSSSSITILSYENKILTYSAYAYLSGSFTVYCM